jgi:hypothetical protein
MMKCIIIKEFFMKNTVKLFGIIALVAVIGFSMAGCDMDESASSTDGRLTITGLSSYNGWKMWLSSSDADNEADSLHLMSKNDPTAPDIGEISITGNSVTVYVWKPWIREGEGKSNLWHSYKGSDQNVTFSIGLWQGENSAYGTVTANFSNGIATAAFVPNP